MYKLTTSANDTDGLSIGFDGDRNRRRNELTNNENIKVSIMLELCCEMCSA